MAAQTDLVDTLSRGGAVLFPHCSILSCGDQVSAVVDSCLEACRNTNKNQILIVGVMHPLTPVLQKAKRMEREGIHINNPYRGVFGPGLPNEELLCAEFSLDNFVFLLEHAVKRKGMAMPKIVLRYPFILYGQPNNFPDIEGLKHLAQESIVVGTSDLFHYGTAYDYYGVLTDNPSEKIPISQKAHTFAREIIQENLRLLFEGDWHKYIQYCIDTNSDGRDVGQLLCFLLGPLNDHIRDLRLVDVSHFYPDKPQPNWVAATLVELKPRK
ncbi:MAG TPA: hypothetical protein VGJ00_10070 [Rhabdochlamydiaceae bacterium]